MMQSYLNKEAKSKGQNKTIIPSHKTNYNYHLCNHVHTNHANVQHTTFKIEHFFLKQISNNNNNDKINH